jgi:NAD(P)-dependent dehydrogenase (short-subunit alcohol dehydrogenase family)
VVHFRPDSCEQEVEPVDDKAVAIVTGANSGIGRATAVRLAAQGWRVFGTVRRVASATKLMGMADGAGTTVEIIEVDVADDDSVGAGVAAVLGQTGRVDVLVNNAGIAANATVEEAPPARYLDVFNVNVCGAVRCIQAVLPSMRARGTGCIVNVTSVAGRLAALAQAPYVASKWALEGVSEELALEVAPFGIRVVIIEPGVTKTAMFPKNVDSPNITGAYEGHYRRMFQMYAAGIPNATDPFEVADVIHHAVTTDQPRLRYTTSWGGDAIVSGRRRLSDEEWVAMGAAVDDADYYARFAAAFGLDIAPAG